MVDEVDKHLHIKLQKEILPKLFKLFPNIQFIVSSHSPFVTMGLVEQLKNRTKLIDIDHNGIVISPENNDQYQEVYNMMIAENDRFAKKYSELQAKVEFGTKPIIVTEGKTDVSYLKKAHEKLNIAGCDVDYFEISEDWGNSKLDAMLKELSRVEQQHKVIGIFDRDVANIVANVEAEDQCCKDYGNNVYAFCIPKINGADNPISIEHYFGESAKKEQYGTRLYFGSEFYESGNSIDGEHRTRIGQIQHKVAIDGVIDDKVYKSDDLEETASVAMSKSVFADLIANDADFITDFDFTLFEPIFDKIKRIINPNGEGQDE
jgi:hypothetical protein